MRKLLLAAAAASLFSAARAQADTILIINDYGTGQVTIPAYYVGGCVGNQCSGVDGYPYSIASNTLPQNHVTPATPAGNVSDMITFSAAPPAPGTCTPAPACNNEFTDVNFQSVSGLDMTGTPEACASVGGCAFIYNGSVQTVGTLTYSGLRDISAIPRPAQHGHRISIADRNAPYRDLDEFRRRFTSRSGPPAEQ